MPNICRNFWTMTFGNRVDGIMFHPDGPLSGVRLWHHEHRWRIADQHLLIMNDRDDVIIAMRPDEQDFRGYGIFGNKKIFGTLRESGASVKAQHYRERANNRILSEARLGASRDFLFVSFNSLGKPYSGVMNEWEVFHLPNELSVDYIRFSSTNTPRGRHVDKEERILSQLHASAQMGYRKMLFCGMSAGGYAALLYSTLLAEAHPRSCCQMAEP